MITNEPDTLHPKKALGPSPQETFPHSHSPYMSFSGGDRCSDNGDRRGWSWHIFLTSLYTLILKRYAIVDVLTIALDLSFESRYAAAET